MATYAATHRVDRTPEGVFDVIGTNCYENHPRWEREVVEIRPLTPGPIGLGSRAIMIREEYGRRSETEHEVTAFEPGRRIAFRHPQSSMLFELAFDLRPGESSGTDLTVRVKKSRGASFASCRRSSRSNSRGGPRGSAAAWWT
jgi:hypothetical protein